MRSLIGLGFLLVAMALLPCWRSARAEDGARGGSPPVGGDPDPLGYPPDLVLTPAGPDADPGAPDWPPLPLPLEPADAPPAPPPPPAPVAPAAVPPAAAPPAEPAAVGAPVVLEASLPPVEMPAPPDAVALPPQVRREARFPVHGSVRVRYRGRWTEVDEDHDLYQYLILRLRDEEDVGFSASFHGRLTEDLDGRGDDGQFFVFDSITDSYDHRVNGRVYHAYVNYRFARGPLEKVRVGRQWVEAGDLFLMDGIHASSRPTGRGLCLSGWAFVGIPTHLYESSFDGDFMAGAGFQVEPWRGGQFRFDYVHFEDENRYYGDESNNLFTVAFRQRVARTVALRGSYQHLDEDPHRVALAFDAHAPGPDVFVRGTFNALVNRQTESVYDIDPYFAIALQLEPYWDGHLAVSKGFGDHFAIEGGAMTRQLIDEDDDSRFNREFQRYYAMLSSYEWPLRTLSLSLTGEWWNSRDDIYALGFDVDWRPSRCWRFSLGTDFAQYRIDFFANEEREDSRAIYLRGTFRPTPNWRLDLSLRVEKDDFDTYTTLNAGVLLDF